MIDTRGSERLAADSSMTSVVLHVAAVLVVLVGLAAAVAADWQWRALAICAAGIVLTVPAQDASRRHQAVVAFTAVVSLVVLFAFVRSY